MPARRLAASPTVLSGRSTLRETPPKDSGVPCARPSRVGGQDRVPSRRSAALNSLFWHIGHVRGFSLLLTPGATGLLEQSRPAARLCVLKLDFQFQNLLITIIDIVLLCYFFVKYYFRKFTKKDFCENSHFFIDYFSMRDNLNGRRSFMTKHTGRKAFRHPIA